MLRKLLLACGVLSSLLYAGMNLLVPMRWDGYSVASQTISELSAIGAPTRPLWIPLGAVYSVLLAAFGWGVWKSIGPKRRLRVMGGALVAHGAIALFWPPMHLRGTVYSLTDTLHIVWMAVTGLLMLVAIGIGAGAFGSWFRLYSIATILILLVFGALTGMDGPRIAADLPTPWVGIWERISAAAFITWIAVLAVALLRVPSSSTGGRIWT